MFNNDVLDILKENKLRSNFLKKETILIGLILIFIITYLFYLNDWGNSISFSCMLFLVFAVSFKLFDLFHLREKEYQRFIKIMINEIGNENVEREDETYLSFDVKLESSDFDDLMRPSFKKFSELASSEPEEVSMEEIIFSKKILKEDYESLFQVKPSYLSISDMLKERADERRKMMKRSNYRFGTRKFKIKNQPRRSFYDKEVSSYDLDQILNILYTIEDERFLKMIEFLLTQFQELNKKTEETNDVETDKLD